HVSVRSAPGEGAEFEVLLPAVEDAPTESAPAAVRGPHPRGDEAILLVEDDPSLRRVVGEVLASSGYRVRATGNGDEALDVLEPRAGGGAPFALLLSDLVMPGMGGRELAARARQRGPGMRVLLMSGYDGAAEPGTGADPGADEAVIAKPFTATSL